MHRIECRPYSPPKLYESPYQPSIERMLQLLDGRLQHINRAFNNNLRMCDIYVNLMKGRNQLHSQELKDYYHYFTENKAEELVFNHITHHQPMQPLATNKSEEGLALKRLYFRLLEKAVLKISFFISNKSRMRFLTTKIHKLAKQTQSLTEQIANVLDLSTMDQNELLQNQIYVQLISKGYISSVDEFFRINGIDIEHQQYYNEKQQNNYHQENLQEKQIQLQDHQLEAPQWLANLQQKTKKNVKRVQSRPTVQQINSIINRKALKDIELKYKKIITNIEGIINADSQRQLFSPLSKGRKNSRRNTRYSKKSILAGPSAEKTPVHMQSGLWLPSSENRPQSKDKHKTIFINQSALEVQRSVKPKLSHFFSQSFVNTLDNAEGQQASIGKLSTLLVDVHRNSETVKAKKGVIVPQGMLKNKTNNKNTIKNLLNICKNRALDGIVKQFRESITQQQSKSQAHNSQSNFKKTQQESHQFTRIRHIQHHTSQKQLPIQSIPSQTHLKPILINAPPADNWQQRQRLREYQQRMRDQHNLTISHNWLGSEYMQGHLIRQNQQISIYQSLVENIEKERLKTMKQAFFHNRNINNRLERKTVDSVRKGVKGVSLRPSEDLEVDQSGRVVGERSEKREKSKLRTGMVRSVAHNSPLATPMLPPYQVYDRRRRVIIKV